MTGYEQICLWLKTGEGENLTTYTLKKNEWQQILQHAHEDNNFAVIEALAHYTPIEKWLNIKAIEKDFNITLDNPFEIKKFLWCVTTPQVRKLLSPRTRGRFVHIGLWTKNWKMIEAAVGEGDWEKELPEGLLFYEAERLENATRNNCTPLDIEHFQWVEKHLFPHFSLTECYTFIFACLALSVVALRRLTEQQITLDLGLKDTRLDRNTLAQEYQQSLRLYSTLKEKIFFEQIPHENQQKIITFLDNTRSTHSMVAYNVKEHYEEWARELESFYAREKNYQNLNKILPEKEAQSEKIQKI